MSTDPHDQIDPSSKGFGAELGRIGRIDVGQAARATLVWTQEQDDQAAFEEAMETADISVRRLEALVAHTKNAVELLYNAKTPRARQRAADQALDHLSTFSRCLESPAVSRWRQRFSRSRGKRHSQQHVLEAKLKFATALLAEHGIDLDLEMARGRVR